METPGSIENCYIFSFLGPRQPLTYTWLKEGVVRTVTTVNPVEMDKIIKNIVDVIYGSPKLLSEEVLLAFMLVVGCRYRRDANHS